MTEQSISEKIKLFQDYINSDQKILHKATTRNDHLIVDFLDFMKYDLEMSYELLQSPEETLKLMEKALYDLRDNKPLKIRFKNVDQLELKGTDGSTYSPCNIRIRDMRVTDYGKLVVATGVARYVSDIHGELTSIRFECPVCGNILNVLQRRFGEKKEPTRCGCGRKGKFLMIDDVKIDSQRITIEEEFESLDGNQQPNKIDIIIEYGLTNKEIEKYLTLGSRVAVTGILMTRPRIVKGKITTELEKYIEANYIKQLDEKYKEIEISKEDITLIEEYAKRDDCMDVWVNSFAQHIYGYNMVKEAIILQMFGGVTSTDSDTKHFNRGNSHILLIGDPSSGKTQLAKSCESIALKYRYCQGMMASKAGLTVSMIKDDLSGQWGLDAGAFILASKGICVVDELDKMSNDDREHMHEGMEEQKITIDKATIHTTLKAETAMLACANWKESRFNIHEDVYKQIDMPDSLISRFDLYFTFFDKPDMEKDSNIMRHMLKSRAPDLYKKEITPKETITPMFMKKYLIYAKNYNPKIPQDVAEKIVQKYVSIRSEIEKNKQERVTISITSRQGEAIQRLCEASARMHLRDVTEDDFKRVIKLVEFSLKSIAYDYEAGKVDIDKIETGVSSKERHILHQVLDVVDKLSDKFSDGIIPIEEIVNSFPKDKERDIDYQIERMKRSGDLYEPRKGFVKKL